MFFVCGTADRHVFSGVTDSNGTVEQLVNYTPDGVPRTEYDWGESATLEAATRTAYVILLSVTHHSTAARLAEKFARSIVLRMESDRMWMLNSGEITSWLQRRVMVA